MPPRRSPLTPDDSRAILAPILPAVGVQSPIGEFEQIQRVHFGRQQDPAARARAKRTLESCLDAIAAFRAITGLEPVTLATPDDCAAFQSKALTLPKNWRLRSPRSKTDVGCDSANNVLKWSRSLQAAFERANRNAPKRKCVRGVVDARLTESVLTAHYVRETDEQLRHKSNRTYRRILASLPDEVARRFGHVEAGTAGIEERLQAAIAARDWPLVAELSARLAGRARQG